MGLFRSKPKNKNEEFLMINNLITELNNLERKDEYISRNEYLDIMLNCKNQIDDFITMKKKGILQSWCKKNSCNYQELLDCLNKIEKYPQKIEIHNKDFVNNHLKTEKEYFDHILEKIDNNISLDEEQRRVALDDEDYSLVIAGAGAGKTTTLAGKVKYLVDKRNIKPEEILIISFTNKAVNELKDKIQKKLGINCAISTFHSCGRAIVKKDKELAETSILKENFWFIQNYISEQVAEDKNLLSKLIMLFAYYLDIDEDISKNISKEDHFSIIERNDFTTLRENIEDYNREFIEAKTKNRITIKNENLRSIEEVKIANFLYLNSLNYEYEKEYPYRIPNSNKLYTPDFYIEQGDKKCYIEHFGITEDLKNTMYTKEELDRYVVNMKFKKSYHEIHGTDLICTYSRYNDGRPLIDHLKEELIKHGFTLTKKSDEDVYNLINKQKDNKYIYRFCNMASTFLHLFKTNNYSQDDFKVFRTRTKNPRTLLFFDIMEEVYLAYQLYLKTNKLVDFEDMINESAKLLKEAQSVRDKLHFKYVLIDEFQDISRARINLVKEIKNATNAKICVVGDDWQSIYRFAGSDINLFTHFKEEMGYASILKITRTYRNAQELIDIAGNFVQKNDAQTKKNLISDKHINKPITVYTYDGSYKSKTNPGFDYHRAELLEKVIGLIKKVDPNSLNILLVGRYNFELQKLLDSNLFVKTNEKSNMVICPKYPDVKLTFMTAHSTKGLTYDNVIVLNCANARYGFPAQIEDDPIFAFVRNKDDSFDFSEERRLFYVALTRTKNRVFLLVPDKNPSPFVLELLDDYKGKINLHDDEYEISKEVQLIGSKRKSCPVCGYPLILRQNPAYGLRLYICTNEPEVCDFMTNDLHSHKDSIHVCSKCGNGVMIVKKRKKEDSYFFGCTNYIPDGTGCNNIEDIKYQ